MSAVLGVAGIVRRMKMQGLNRYHDSRFQHDPRRDCVWKEICRYLQARYIPPSARILEIGAGYCHFINNIKGAQRHALDMFDQLAHYAGPGVTAHVQSCVSLNAFQEQSFDVVFASNLFEHLSRSDLFATLHEIRRVLAEAGTLIIIQPNYKYCYREYFDDYTHVEVYTHLSLADLLQTVGYDIVAVQARFLPFSMKSHLPKAPWLVRMYLALPYRPFAGQMLVIAKRQG